MKQAPKHLNKHGRAHWKKTLADFHITENYNLERLANLCKLQDEKFELQELAKVTEPTFTDRWGQPKSSPVFKMLHDVYVLELRYVREMGLDLPEVNSYQDENRPPRQF